MKLNKRQFKKWIQALDSGEYTQGASALESSPGNYCCLGVACKVLIPRKKLELLNDRQLDGAFPEDQVYSPKWLIEINDNFSEKTGESLSKLNDTDHLSFSEIAICLELVYIHKILD